MPAHGGGVTHDDPRRALLQGLASAGYRGKVAVAVHSKAEREALPGFGATVAFEPFEDAADQALELMAAQDAPGAADAGERAAPRVD